MKTLAIIAIVIGIISLVIGAGIVVLDGTLKLITPNALLRITDTAFLFAVALLLLTIAEKK